MSLIIYDYNLKAFKAGLINNYFYDYLISYSINIAYKKFIELFRGVLNSCEKDSIILDLN